MGCKCQCPATGWRNRWCKPCINGYEACSLTNNIEYITTNRSSYQISNFDQPILFELWGAGGSTNRNFFVSASNQVRYNGGHGGHAFCLLKEFSEWTLDFNLYVGQRGVESPGLALTGGTGGGRTEVRLASNTNIRYAVAGGGGAGGVLAPPFRDGKCDPDTSNANHFQGGGGGGSRGRDTTSGVLNRISSSNPCPSTTNSLLTASGGSADTSCSIMWAEDNGKNQGGSGCNAGNSIGKLSTNDGIGGAGGGAGFYSTEQCQEGATYNDGLVQFPPQPNLPPRYQVFPNYIVNGRNDQDGLIIVHKRCTKPNAGWFYDNVNIAIVCVCSPGYYQDSSENCIPCGYGTYQDNWGNKSCADCSCGEGYYASECGGSSRGTCIPCASCQVSGMYRSGCSGDNPGTCIQCGTCGPEEYRADCTGSNPGTCMKCRTSCSPGEYLLECGNQHPGICLPCWGCPLGEMRVNCGGKSVGECKVCRSCSNETFLSDCRQNSSGVCLPCPNNTVNLMTLPTTIQSCMAKAGYYGARGNLVIPCPSDHYCPLGSVIPEKCPMYSTSLPLSVHLGDCMQIPGYFSDSTGASVSCLPGFYCLGGKQRPMECPLNTDSPRMSQSILNCSAKKGFFGDHGKEARACNASYFCVQGSTRPTACPANTFSDLGASSNLDCYPAAGFFGQSGSVASQCPSNFYCSARSVNAKPCPGNSSSPAQSSQCLSFPGFFITSVDEPANICPPNHYCERGSTQPSPCPPNTQSLTRSSSKQDCISKPGAYGQPGFFATLCPFNTESLPNSTHSAQCVAKHGYYGSPGFSPQKCPENTGTVSSNSLTLFDCVALPGFFQTNIGESAQECPVDFYCPGLGTLVPRSCKWNQDNLNKPGASTCDSKMGVGRIDCNCMPGTVLVQTVVPLEPNSNKTTIRYSCEECPPYHIYKNDQNKCLKCPPGFFCDISGTNLPNTCSAGWFRLNDKSDCISCPAGTFSNASNASACLDCRVGTYNPSANASRCLTCNISQRLFAPSTGSTICTICPSPRIVIQNRTCGCPMDTFYDESANLCVACTYSPSSRQCHADAIMRRCPEASSVDTSKCTCKPDFFGDGVTRCIACGQNDDCTCAAGEVITYKVSA